MADLKKGIGLRLFLTFKSIYGFYLSIGIKKANLTQPKGQESLSSQGLDKHAQRTQADASKTQAETKPRQVIKGDLIHPKLNPFFQWLSGSQEITKEKYGSLISKTNGYPLTITKALWGLYFPLQVVGLVSEKFAHTAKAFYGFCWSIVFSCYRPWKNNRDKLTDKGAPEKIPTWVKNLYSTNEHFRLGMGSLVSLVYGGGALGMLWGLVKGDDEIYKKGEKFYTTGMFNQNQIFSSMDFGVWLKRKWNPSQLPDVDLPKDNIKARVETANSILFIPQIIARAIGSVELFGKELGDGIKRFVNTIGYFGYGLWASRFGIMKLSEKTGGDLEPLHENEKGKAKIFDLFLHDTQKYSAYAFSTTLPALSGIAAVSEILGFGDFAHHTFKLEGILERLNPTIASWCMRTTWLNTFTKQKNNKS